MIADFFMTASPVPRILRALRREISDKSGSFDGHIEASYKSATRLTRAGGLEPFRGAALNVVARPSTGSGN
jgi:hypothetical protein